MVKAKWNEMCEACRPVQAPNSIDQVLIPLQQQVINSLRPDEIDEIDEIELNRLHEELGLMDFTPPEGHIEYMAGLEVAAYDELMES